MAGSSFGTIFRVATFGESHGPALGAVVDGCPAGLALSEEDINVYMERRRPNGGALSTKRRETDAVEILSGVFEGMTTGTSIALLLKNEDQRSRDYAKIKDVFRPGHADYGFDAKFGFRDYRGGGRSSGRETSARVAAGAVAQKFLQSLNIECRASLSRIGNVDASDLEACSFLIEQCRVRGDSVGSTVSCSVSGLPAGIGDPVFEKLDANLAKAMFSIGAVKGFDIGEGRRAAELFGSENNDAFYMEAGRIRKKSNHAGGILGGISDGSDLNMTVYFKPTPSIALEQETVTRAHLDTRIRIEGRHDPVIGGRAAVVVECMTALVLADALLLNMGARADRIRNFYGIE
ncbi:MAG: chorismate synthase [Lachnospiraceae bacterium]|nr:chorismate synthase [Lachnospiraceae bacterium]